VVNLYHQAIGFQSPDGDCLYSYKSAVGAALIITLMFQSPDGDCLDSYNLYQFLS
jgi:hypothetical protein